MPIEIRPVGTPPGLTHPEKAAPSLDEVSGPQTAGFGEAPRKAWEILQKHAAVLDPDLTELPWLEEKHKGLAFDFPTAQTWGAAQDELESYLKTVKAFHYGLDLLMHAPPNLFATLRPYGQVRPGERVRAHLIAYTRKGATFLEELRAAALRPAPA